MSNYVFRSIYCKSNIKMYTYREIPPSGICQTFTTQSSEPLAITLSLCGHHAMSNTGPL